MPSTNFPPFLVLGKVTVAAAGTPVGLLDAFLGGSLKAAAGGPQKLRVASILFTVLNVITVNTG
jgi:hypothetical protein